MTKEDDNATGGAATTAGLIYQAAVVVWAALELMLIQRTAAEIDIEPPSHEDAEAELHNDEANGAVTGAKLPLRRLVIQVKLRNTGPWSVADFDRLLKRGVRRNSAAARLKENLEVRFLLVTTADVAAGAMQDLKVSEFGEFPMGAPSAATLAEYADAGGSRIAVLNVATEWVVEQKIRNLLEAVFKVPHDQFDACRRALREEAIRRSLPGANSLWRRQDLQATLKAHGAYFSIGPDLDDFVEPDNWQTLVDQARRGAVVITGQSGSGKTLSALKLVDVLREENRALKVKDDARTPGDVNRHLQDRPILFYVEDPWGRYLRSPDSLPWNEELMRVLPLARGDLFFVITTRDDILSQFGDIKDKLKAWTVSLNAEEYGPKARSRLFETRLKRLPSEVALLAVQAKRDALRSLETPLEIERYFVQLALGPKEDENDRDFIRRAIHAAHHKAFEDEVAETVVARGDVGWGTLIWALLKTSSLAERDMMRAIRRPVQQAVPALQGGSLDNLVNMLIVSRSLKQPGTAISYAHPRVEAGLEKAMDMEPELSGDVLEATVDALVSFDRSEGDIAGRRGAAAIIAAGLKEREAKERPSSRIQVSSATQASIDAYLETALLNDSEAIFNESLRLAATAGSEQSPLCALAKWLIARDRPTAHRWFVPWEMENRDDAWFERVRRAEGLSPLLNRFVRLTLPSEQREYPKSLLKHLDRFGVDLGDAFRQAASDVVDGHYDGRAEVIVIGALRDIGAATALAGAAGEVLAGIRDRNARQSRDDDLPLTNGDYDEEYTEHLTSMDHDEGSVAGQVLDLYVPAVRRSQGWRALDASPVAAVSVDRWLSLLEGLSHRAIPTAELLAIQRHASGGDAEGRFAALASKVWRPPLATALVQRLQAPDVRPEAWVAIVAVLTEHDPGVLLRLQDEWLQTGNHVQALRLHWAVLRRAPAGRGRAMLLRRLRNAAPPDLQTLSRGLANRRTPMTPDGTAALSRLSSHDLDFNTELVKLGVALGAPAQEAIKANLRGWHAWRTEPAEAAIAAAVAAQDWSLVDLTRGHPLAVVRKIALAAWADRSPAMLEDVLGLVSKEASSKVLYAFIGRMTETPTLDRLDVLLSVAGNTWSNYSTPSGEPAYYPLARKAAHAIVDIPSLPDDRLNDVFQIALKTEDPTVRQALLVAIAHGGGDNGRTRLIKYALRDDRKTAVRRAILHALLLTAELLQPSDLEMVTSDMILDAPPTLALALTRLQAAVQPAETLLTLGAALAGSNARRALVLLLGNERHQDSGASLANLLPTRHPARRLLEQPQGRSRLPRASVDDLGDVRIVELVRRALDYRFQSQRQRRPRVG